MDERSAPPPPPTSEPPAPPPGPPPGSWLITGWATAVIRAVVALVVTGLLAQVVAFLFYAIANDRSGTSVADVARIGGEELFAFHHVAFVIRPSGAALSQLQGSGLPISGAKFTAAVALMAGTILVAWLLARGGRAVAEEAGGSALVRGLHGAKIGVPYAILLVALAWAIRVSVPVGGGEVSIHPSYLFSLLWPLGLGLAFGFLGGVRSSGASGWPATAWSGRLRGALAGGFWMLGLALVLAFVGLVLLAPFNIDATKAYFSPFDQSVGDGITAIVATLLVLPNMTAWVLFPSMGACLGATGAVSSVGFSFCLLSYTSFPTSRAFGAIQATGSLDLPNPPAAYFLFVLVPLIAVLVGGMMAVRRGGAATRQEALLTGAAAGVVYGLLALFVAILAGIVVKAGVGGQGIRLRFGPELVPSTLLALAWGVVGGVLGALWEARSLPRAVRPVPVAPGTPWPMEQPGPSPSPAGPETPPVAPRPEPEEPHPRSGS